MAELWKRAGRVLSERTAATLVIVLVLTVGLGIGLQRLDFSTGQNSYIDPASQVAKDNESYQELFGGESMVVLFTIDEGRSVVDLFTPGEHRPVHRDRNRDADERRCAVGRVAGDIAAMDAGLVTKGVASEIIARTIDARAGSRCGGAPAAGRDRHDVAPRRRRATGHAEPGMGEVPALRQRRLLRRLAEPIGVTTRQRPRRTQGRCRRSFPTRVTRCSPLCSWATRHSTACRRGRRRCTTCWTDRTFDNATVTITGTPTFLTDINDYLQGGMLMLGGIAVVVMMVILLVAFKVRWRLLPLVGMARRDHLGIRRVRVHRHEAVTRHNRRPADPHRTRHRVRDPDSEPDRGGTRRSSIRTIRSR